MFSVGIYGVLSMKKAAPKSGLYFSTFGPRVVDGSPFLRFYETLEEDKQRVRLCLKGQRFALSPLLTSCRPCLPFRPCRRPYQAWLVHLS